MLVFGARGRLAAVALGLSSVTFATEVRAEPRPMSLTIGGGVSLGAYEAGYAYYLVESLKRNPGRYTLEVTTGTSAGSANALLAAMASCSPPEPDPRATLLFGTWVGVGFDDLFVPGDVTPDGLFSRRALNRRIEAIDARWKQGLPTTCEVSLGITATRVVARPLVVRTKAFTLPRIEEKFVVRIRGRGDGQPPILSNRLDPGWTLEQALLPVDGAAEGKLWPLSDAILASMAFPIAFAPVPLRHCMTVPSEGGTPPSGSCEPEQAETALFSDGGVLDNQPLQLAERLLRSAARLHAGARLVYLDTDTRTYPPEVTPPPTADSAIGTLQRTLTSFVHTARAKNLITLFETRPHIRKQLSVATTPFPPISEALGAFFGFFDKKLRAFDFDLGMFAAHMIVTDGLHTNLVEEDEPALHPAMEAFSAKSVRPFTCVRGMLEPDANAARTCAQTDLEDTRILLQVTLDRLYAHCRAIGLTSRPPETKHAHCRAGMGGADSPLVPGIDAAAHAGWNRLPDEGDFDHTMRLLGAYRFAFSDLGLTRDEASQAKLRIRSVLGKATDRLVAVQPEYGAALDVLTQPALDSIAYLPPRHLVYGTLGAALEAGWSFTDPLSRARWLRPGLSLTVQALSSLTGESRSAWALPAVGLEIAPHALSIAAAQVTFGARTGWSFSTADNAGFSTCDRTRDTCSRWAVTGLVAASFFGRVRFQVEGVVLPGVRTGESTSWAVLPSAGVQFQWH